MQKEPQQKNTGRPECNIEMFIEQINWRSTSFMQSHANPKQATRQEEGTELEHEGE